MLDLKNIFHELVWYCC